MTDLRSLPSGAQIIYVDQATFNKYQTTFAEKSDKPNNDSATQQLQQQSQQQFQPQQLQQQQLQQLQTQQLQQQQQPQKQQLQQQENHLEQPQQQLQQDEQLQVDIDINNVVCSFNTRCHLNLKKIAMEGSNVVYKQENGMVNMKLRNPLSTASIWSSGKITCTGSTSEEAAKISARRICRILQKLGFRIRFCNFRVVNVLGTCSMPWGIRIAKFSAEHKQDASYEPELHPGVTYKIKSPKATLKVFSTGSITVTAPCVANVGTAIEHIYPLVFPFHMDKPKVTKPHKYVANVQRPYKQVQYYTASDSDEYDSELEEDWDDEEEEDEEY